MFTKVILPLLAISGLALAVLTVLLGARPSPVAQPIAEPAQAPFKQYIGGAGVVESKSENVSVGTVLPGIVTEVYVHVGDQVKTGDTLFKLDDRETQAELAIRRASLSQAKAGVAEAQASLRDTKTQLKLVEQVGDPRAVSVDDLEHRRNAVLLAQAKLRSALAQVESAQAQVKAIEINLQRLTVSAPMDGEILQVKVRLGQYAQTGVLSTPLILMGNLDLLHIRVEIDENDAWRFRKGAHAAAFLRGNRALKTTLDFVRVEPYVMPKQSLTGDSTERVDTRVLQVIYSFDRRALPTYIGQQLDVFIEVFGDGQKSLVEPLAARNARGSP